MKITSEKLAIEVIAEKLSSGFASREHPLTPDEVTLEMMRECVRGNLEDADGNSYLHSPANTTTYAFIEVSDEAHASAPWYDLDQARKFIARALMGGDWQAQIDEIGWELFAERLERGRRYEGNWNSVFLMFREAEIYAFDYHRWRRGWEQRRGEKLPDFWAEPTEADSGTATAKILSASNEVWPVGRPTAKEQILSEHRRRRTERQESGLPEPPMAVEARDLEKWAKEPGNIPADKRAPVADTIRRHLREEKKRRQG